MTDVLLRRFIEAFPAQFLARLLERQAAIYRQTIEVAYNEYRYPDDARYVLPHLLRASWERDLRAIAIDCGLKAESSQHLGENCSCVLVTAQSLILTAHRVTGPNEFVGDAESRKQHSAINAWLDEYADPRLLMRPLPAMDTKDPIYLNLLHGADFNWSDEGVTFDPATSFLRVAIPDDLSKRYIRNWSAQELVAAYANSPEVTDVHQAAIPDNAKPKAKPKIASVKRMHAGA